MKPGGLQAFLSMGGYAFYVWTSYAIVALAIVIEIIAVRARLRRAMKSASSPGRASVLYDDTQ
jgi:heme exporter protein CcmD